jgi:hypothetical protein
MARYSNKEVIETAIRSMRNAGYAYSRWTGKEIAPWYAPEYVYCVKVAEAIAQLKFKPRVYCEFNAVETLEYAVDEYAHDLDNSVLTDKSRFDLIIGTKADTTKCVIELKRNVHIAKQIVRDVARLSEAVNQRNDSDIDAGVSLFTVAINNQSAAKARTNLEERVQRIFADTKEQIRGIKDVRMEQKNGLDSIRSYKADGKTCCWTVGAIVIKA